MVAVRSVRRAAGVRFEVVPPPLSRVLPRMDVALFVGFAASGPLHVPVPVDDPAHFERIFGSDAPLAWDGARGARLEAYLAPGVRSFFLNGGRRCWVVRVAREKVAERSPGATANVFPIAGLLRRGPAGGLEPARLVARSEGSWSDDLRVAATLLDRPLVPAGLSLATSPAYVDVVSRAQDDLLPGDLVRLSFRTKGGDLRVAMFAVQGVEAGAALSPSQPTTRLYVRAAADGSPDLAWFRATPPALVHAVVGTTPIDGVGVPAWFDAVLPDGSYGLVLETDVSDASAPAMTPGRMMAIDFAFGRLWLMLTSAETVQATASPYAPAGVRVTGVGAFVDSPSSPPTYDGLEIERLRLALWTQIGLETPATLSDLGFDHAHPRALWALPSDVELFRAPDDVTDADPRPLALRDRGNELAPLWSDAANPRFALASSGAPGASFLPVGMPYTPDYALPPDAQASTAFERDGLSVFDSSLFVDPDLVDVGVDDLLSEADFLRYRSSVPRRLRGIHAALGVDEATLIAVPDAALPGWAAASEAPLPAGAPAQPVVPGQDGSFVGCGLRQLGLPALEIGAPDAHGSIRITWAPVPGAASYEIQESPDPSFGRGVTSYATSATQLDVYGHSPGVFFFRARSLAGALDSGWSATTAVRVSLDDSGYVVSTTPAPALFDVQTALLRMCAARGDLFALLSLPPVVTADEAAAHVARLCASESSSVLGFGAAYHPWLVGRDVSTGPLRTTPPEGAIAGIYARRAIGRGALIAPANEPLAASVLGLSPRLEDDVWAVLDQQPVNRIRDEAHGLLSMSADTLTDDPDYSPVNVRRLLMLLRRTALDLGATYVFEPNGPQLARSVQGTFTSMLDDLFRRGAFAGARAGDAYRVITDATVNPAASVDQGRFVVELQVAPSRPLSFLTVRLVQTGDRLTVSGGS